MSFQKEEEYILFENEQIPPLFSDILWDRPFFHDNLVWDSPFYNDNVVWQELDKDCLLWEDIYYCITVSDLQQTIENEEEAAAVSQQEEEEEDDNAMQEFFIIEQHPRSTVDFCYYSSKDDITRVDPCQSGSNVSTPYEEEYIHEEEAYIHEEEQFLDGFIRWVNAEDSEDEASYVVYDD
ncbi:hypothetical protein BD770DRAFT_446305 [Pilaira anomala]|nr:hypothetical protein BD770DRAFT_446305 [Pilaira anomala]